MTEIEINESIAKILDAEKTSLVTQQGSIKLRELLTAVYNAQAPFSGIWYKLFGKPKVSPENVILHLPKKVGQYINMSEGGRYLGFHIQITEALELLARLDLLDTNHLFDVDDFGNQSNEQSRYGVSAYGRAFVNYAETEKG